MSQLCNEVLAYENTGDYYHHILELLYPEITAQSFRFGYPSHVNYWNWACTLTDDFLMNRVNTYFAEYTDYVELDDLSASASFSLYPNPAKNVLFVETRLGTSLQTQTYRITNLMGQTILSGNNTAETQQINIESLPAGLYFITVAGETRKFIVE